MEAIPFLDTERISSTDKVVDDKFPFDFSTLKKVHMILIVVILFGALALIMPYDSQMHKCPADGITYNMQSDGFGSQYMNLAMTKLWAHQHDRQFCANPWTRMDHGVNASSMFEFIGGFHMGPLAKKTTDRIHARYAFLNLKDDQIFHRADIFTRQMKQQLRRAYFNTQKPALSLFEPDKKNIALHIRRGDVGRSAMGWFYTPESFYVECIEYFKQLYKRERILFHVFSEGNITNFELLAQTENLKFHLNTNIQETFHHLVSADVLVGSQSTFSM